MCIYFEYSGSVISMGRYVFASMSLDQQISRQLFHFKRNQRQK